jgi:transposase
VKVFGCVDIASAKFIYATGTVFNALTYLNFLEQIARQYHRHKVLYIQDNASYHKDGRVWDWFRDNRKWIEVYNLPPYSPELNATERLWHHTRVSGTHNRYFDSEAALLGALEHVFADMQNDPSKIAGYLRPFL